MIKTGAAHIASLRDGREVYLNGKLVKDVTTHPAFRHSIESYAALYDFQSRPENQATMLYASPSSDARVSTCWQLPTTYQELVERRLVLEKWAELHYGFMGRSPDHVSSCLGGMVMGLDVFQQYNPERAAALDNYFKYARDNDLFLTYVIINPQADRGNLTHEQADPFLSLGKAGEYDGGIIVRGAKMLATSGIMANEVFVTCIQPLQAGDEAYALSFAIPMNAPGLKILSRKSYEENAGSQYDSPLASRFDENDAVLYFDDVKVPWDRVFIDGDTAMCGKQFHATPAHVFQNYQCQVRLSVKLRFLAGIALKIAQINGIINIPSVRETLGQIAAQAQQIQAMVAGMESSGSQAGAYFIPNGSMLYASQVIAQQLYGHMLTQLRELAGGGLIMLPSSVDDFRNPELSKLIGKTQQSPAASSEERVKFFKLAWDAIGSEFASRHQQYEMFYAGAGFVIKGHAFRTYEWNRASQLVDNMLASYSLDEVLASRPAL